MDLNIPYGIGDFAEYRCFEEGYRGAWFRCKIHDMDVKESQELHLEYIDYPGESKEWVKLFQKDPACTEKQAASEQIMIRPSFPWWYWNHKLCEHYPNDALVAIVHEAWKVGDKVDWLSEGCYWTANITKILNKDTVEVELLKPPLGEGQRYAAYCEDLRPTLDWSVARGWTVPLSQAGDGKCWLVACIAQCIPAESESEEDTSIYQAINVENQYVQTVAEIRCKLKDLLKRTLKMERRAGLFGKWAWGRA